MRIESCILAAAWGGSSWVPLTQDGLAARDLKRVNFTTLEGAISYAESNNSRWNSPDADS
ncbi:MAG TPA: hypothetical protein VHV29_17760 [Terriglobales bacterium]|nr:hypothetical protein [Terriglobales bacterium]